MAEKKSSYQRGIKIPTDIIKSAARAGITPEEMMVKRLKEEKAYLKRNKLLKTTGNKLKTFGKYAMRGILPVTLLTELIDSKPAYYTGGKPVIKKKKKKKNKKKTYNTGGKIMQGYKAGGKV